MGTHGGHVHESQGMGCPGRRPTKQTETIIHRGETRPGQPPLLSETQFLCIARGLIHPEPRQTSLINHSVFPTSPGDSRSFSLPPGLDDLQMPPQG